MSDKTTPQDSAAMPPASAGSLANDQAEVLAKGIADIIRIATEPDWIPVTERLPMTSADVLVTEQGEDEQFIGSLENGRWSCSSTNHTLRVTHWMPLPAPPTDGK
jgi:hypothetical protein